MIVLRGPKKQRNQNQRKNKTSKKKTKNLNLPVDVIHGIQEDRCGISWIYNNTVNRVKPIFIQ